MLAGCNDMGCTERYRKLIREAEKYGMPVKFLHVVEKNYDIICPPGAGTSYVAPRLNRMVLYNDSVFQWLRDLKVEFPLGEGIGLHTLYHESVHAYLDIRENEDPGVRDFIQAAFRHYNAAPMQNGTTSRDPMRVLQEAAAGYVGHRIAGWWSAFEWIAFAASGQVPTEEIQEVLEKVERDYNRAMAETRFGYEAVGGFLGLGTKQLYTSRGVSAEMKLFLDAHILEGKVPDRFSEVPGFRTLIQEARQNHHGKARSSSD